MFFPDFIIRVAKWFRFNIIYVMKAKKAIKNVFVEYFLYLLFFLVLLVFFKDIRDLFSLPIVGEDKIVGYSAYFGYPLYFDNLLFFYIIFCPIFAWIILTLRKKIW